MAESNEVIDKRVDFAAEEIRQERNAGHAVNVREICLLWDVPRNRVMRRLQGIGPRTQRKATNTKLSAEQEEALKTYLIRLDEIGLPAKLDHIRAYANSILAKAHIEEAGEDPPTVGGHWPKRFLERMKGLYKVKETPLDIQRLISHDCEGLLDWYGRFERLRQQYGVIDEDIWNFDETGFRIGIGKNQWIITSENSKRRYSASDTVRKLVTSIEAISATGEVIEPMLILPGQLHLEKFYQDLPDDVLVGMSESGYSNDSLALEWLHHFDRQSARYQKGVHRILVCDGSDSHLTAEFLAFCEVKLIHIFVLPPHTTHLLQPLDVVLFQPYKHFHAKVVDQATRTGCDKFNQVEFLASIASIRSSTFKRNSIKSAFRESGLIPYDPYKVITKIQKDSTHQVTPEPTSPSLIPPTPLTIRALQEQAKDLQEAPPERQTALQKKFSKGALIQAIMGAEAIQHLAETTAAVAARKKRQSASGRQLQKGGVLYSQQARSMRQERENEEEQKKQDREDRQILAHIQRMPAEQQSAFMQEMKEDNLERATRLQARITQRRQQAARRRAETRARNREAAQRELEEEAE